MPEYIGRQLGNYRIIRLLGEGGFAQVYLSEHIYLKTTAAIKVLLANLPENDLQAFLNEARLIAHLRHPQIVRVLEFGVGPDNVPFLVMSYAPNGTLRNRHPKGSLVPQESVVAYVRQVSAALQYAHEQKIVHRDVKPENMLVGRSDQVLLSDFGIAIAARDTLSQEQANIGGTAAYMAPEQLQGKPRPASDQYALGIVVYEWLCGKPPFEGPGFIQMASQHLLMPPPPLRERLPHLSIELEAVVMKALAKDPAARFPNVQAFADALANVCTEKTPLSSFPLPKADPSSKSLSKADTSSYSTVPLALHATKPTTINTVSTQAVPFSDVPARKRTSRRTVVIALTSVAGLSAVGIGATWFTLTNASTTSTPSLHTTTTASKTPIVASKPPIALPSRPVGTTLVTYSKHTASVTGLAWSPDGRWLASSSADKTIHISSTIDNTQAFVYTSHTNSVQTVAWSPNGQYIASGSKDKTVRVWDASFLSQNSQGHTLEIYQNNTDADSVSWSPDSTQIASTGVVQMQTWDATTGKHVIYYPDPTQSGLPPALGPVNPVAWSPNGRYIASSLISVAIWDAASAGRLLTYRGHGFVVVHGLAWSPDNTHVASASEDKTVQVWDINTGTTLFTYKGHSDAVYSVAWSPDGKYIASASRDTTVQVWNASTGKLVYTYQGHTAPVNAVTWAADSKHLASAGEDKKVLMWQGI